MGASVSGIDAASELIGVARARSPEADLRIGSMFECHGRRLVDVALSINAIWGGVREALSESVPGAAARRRAGMSFWAWDHHSTSALASRCSRCVAAGASRVDALAQQHRSAGRRRGHADESRVRRGRAREPDLCGRVARTPAGVAALSSIGPAVPALRSGDVAAIRRDVIGAIEPCRDERGIYRSATPTTS